MTRINSERRIPHSEFRMVAHEAGACGYVLKENLLELRRWLQAPLVTDDTEPAGR